MRAAALAVALIALACAGGSAYALRVPAAPKCTVFPKNNPWNRRVDKLPVARNSAAVIASIGVDTGLHADFGSGLWEGSPIGIPFDVVTRKTPRTKVGFEYADESDRVGYPIPKRVHIEGGSDHHALLLDRDACRLYELGGLEKQGGRWHAWAGATWSLRSNRVRPAGWTSADAAGLPIFPGLARWDEAKRGVIDHALRFTVQRTRRAYLYPARHYASSLTDANLPPMGLRVRLKASFDIRPYPRQARIVLTALKRYGMLVADNGSNWYISGAPSPGWSNDQLHTLGKVTGSNFEVVDTSSSSPSEDRRDRGTSCGRRGHQVPRQGHERTFRSAGASACPPCRTGSNRSPCFSTRSSASRMPKSRGRTFGPSSSQRSGVETGAPGFGRTE